MALTREVRTLTLGLLHELGLCIQKEKAGHMNYGEVPKIQFLGNAHVVILDFVMKSQVRRKNGSGAA